MPLALFNPTNPRTNPWNFRKKILRICDFEKLSFFELAILIFQKKKLLHFKQVKGSWISTFNNGLKFWWLPWFPAKNHSPRTFQPPVWDQTIFLGIFIPQLGKYGSIFFWKLKNFFSKIAPKLSKRPYFFFENFLS